MAYVFFEMESGALQEGAHKFVWIPSDWVSSEKDKCSLLLYITYVRMLQNNIVRFLNFFTELLIFFSTRSKFHKEESLELQIQC